MLLAWLCCSERAPRTQLQDLNPAYNLLLRSELLGASNPGPISPDKAQQLEQLRSPASPGRSLFRFKTGDVHSPHGGPQAQSPFVVSPVGDDTGTASPFASPRRAPRKIARAPFKVRRRRSGRRHSTRVHG